MSSEFGEDRIGRTPGDIRCLARFQVYMPWKHLVERCPLCVGKTMPALARLSPHSNLKGLHHRAKGVPEQLAGILGLASIEGRSLAEPSVSS